MRKVMSLTNKTYLIVDDDAIAIDFQIRILKKIGIKNIKTATNGFEALNILESKEIDCVITDFNMPEMDGLQLLKQIRTNQGEINNNMPVVMVTSHNNRDLIGVSMALSVNAIILKPLKKNSLEEKLNVLFQNDKKILPIESYANVNVEAAAEFIKTNAHMLEIQSNHKTSDKYVSASTFFNKQNKSERKISNSKYNPKSVSKFEHCSIDKLKIGSVLMKDIFDKNGRKLLAEGQTITQSILNRIHNLNGSFQQQGDVFVQSI